MVVCVIIYCQQETFILYVLYEMKAQSIASGE